MTRLQERPPSFFDEADRVKARRQMLGAGVEADAPVMALALSGGGIRSATFALGVMQALNAASIPAPNETLALAATAEEIAGDPSHPAFAESKADSRLTNLLARFDYLSTVSGGGYVGSFFCSLFVPGRLDTSAARATDAREASRDAALLAHDVMADDPPGRMRIEATSGHATLIRQPLAWLRENGRYLAPTGAGDMLYAVALAIRNWFAIQYVLATVIVAALAFLMLIRTALVVYAGLAPLASTLIWASGVAVIAWWSFPIGVAFWFAQAEAGQSDAAIPQRPSLAGLGDLALGLFLTGSSIALMRTHVLPSGNAFGVFFFAIGVQALIGFTIYEATRRGRSVTDHRVWLTRGLALSFKCAGFFFLFALADTLALYGYNRLLDAGHELAPAKLSALLAAVIWAVRHLSVLFDQKSASSWWRKVPIDVLAAVLAFAIAIALIVIWAILIDWMVWDGAKAQPEALDTTSLLRLVLIAVVTAIMALIVGQFPAFINLSSLQSIYSARLTRAYLGASNGKRLAARMSSEGMASPRGGSVAEPLPTDQLTHDTYYAPQVLAPLHIINVTVNQTTDANELLVQSDRKGLPLAVLPTGFTIDGTYATLARNPSATSVERPLTIGQWVGTSGAAVSTGLGHTTTRGLSLLLGLANMRLGVWWQSGRGTTERSALEYAFATQSYLLSELTAQFHGLRRRWQYLSDGGHFDNTGIYELLRPERKVRLIVACDNGADVEGRFSDLANLIRLARIDFGLELEINREICGNPDLGHVFGLPEDLVRASRSEKCVEKIGRKCAMLIDVYLTDPETQSRERKCRVIVVKPRVIDGTPLDVVQYASAHPTFPNESTAQQFFDEAQWESYRRLGVAVGRAVFGLGENAAAGASEALWRFLRI